ncbi:MAG: hypothetical protein ACI8WM_001485 [Burkholderiaceae bacterium]|jgi:hypothetical protein
MNFYTDVPSLLILRTRQEYHQQADVTVLEEHAVRVGLNYTASSQ